MARLIEALFAGLAVPAVVAAGLAWAYIRRLRRPILLSPTSAFKPPLRWRWSLSQAAIYHRRMVLALRTARATAEGLFAGVPTGHDAGLRRALGSARRRDSHDGGWEGVLGELEGVAVTIDRRLIALEREPREVRRRMAAGFEQDVAEVEEAAAEAVGMFRSWQRSLPDGSASAVSERLSALRQALEEIRELSDTASGEIRPNDGGLPGERYRQLP